MGSNAIPLLFGTSVFNAYNDIQEGNAEATVLASNARQMRKLAIDAVNRGRYEAGVMQGEGTRTIAAATVAAGAGGVRLDSGSVLATAETTRETAALDAEMIKTNALREALGLQYKADMFTLQARLARKAGRTKALGSLIGGASSVANMSSFPKLGSG